MEELANQIQRALDERLYPSGVYSFRDLAQEVEGQLPEEYAVYTITGEKPLAFASDLPVWEKISLQVRYFAVESRYSSQHIRAIQEAAHSLGFRGWDIEPIYRVKPEEKRGALLEFTLERAVEQNETSERLGNQRGKNTL